MTSGNVKPRQSPGGDAVWNESKPDCGCRYDGPVQVVSCADHNAAAKNLNRAQAVLLGQERELDLLRRLEVHLSDRRKMEPRHSREDHECPECETLAELRHFRKVQDQSKESRQSSGR